MQISVTVTDSGSVNVGGVPARKITFTASNEQGLADNKIFLVRQRGDRVEFVTVCGASDLDNFPVSAPEEDAADPLFRTNTFDLITDQPAMIDKVRAEVDRRVRLLIQSLWMLGQSSTPQTTIYTPSGSP